MEHNKHLTRKERGCVSNHQCESDTYMGDQCGMSARYDIDGIKLCHQHAGSIAIQKLLNLNKIKKLGVLNKNIQDPLCDYSNNVYAWRQKRGISF